MIIVRRCSVSEIERSEGFTSLLSEYASESQIQGLPTASAKMETYRILDKSSTFALFGAFSGDVVVGVVIILTHIIPHYGIGISVTESLFAAKSHRKSGVGLKLIRAAEAHAREVGSPALLISAPINGVLDRVLHGMDYCMTNTVFMKAFRDE